MRDETYYNHDPGDDNFNKRRHYHHDNNGSFVYHYHDETGYHDHLYHDTDDIYNPVHHYYGPAFYPYDAAVHGGQSGSNGSGGGGVAEFGVLSGLAVVHDERKGRRMIWLAVALTAMFMSGICFGYALRMTSDLTSVIRKL